MAHIIQLSERRKRLAPGGEMALYLRVGRNDHPAILELIARGERRFFGVVIDAQAAQRQSELVTEAAKHGFETILDTKSQPLALPGGHTDTLATLPWAHERTHRRSDFTGAKGASLAERIVAFALEHGFSTLLAPTHVLREPNDPWLDIDIAMIDVMNRAIRRSGVDLRLIYSLCVPISLLREPAHRRALMIKLQSIQVDALWLKTDQFGGGATGEKTVAYIEAARELQAIGLPIVADHVGGLPGLALLAFEGVGGIAHGITLYEQFDSGHWRRVPQPGSTGRMPPTRVYLNTIDLHMKKEPARLLMDSSPRCRRLLACADTQCCENGATSMVTSPAHHFVVQRAQQVEKLNSVPNALRSETFLDDYVRPASDAVYSLLSAKQLPEESIAPLDKKQKTLSRFRHTLGNLAKADEYGAIALKPVRLDARKRSQ